MEALRKKIIMFAESAWIAGTSCRGESVGQQADSWKFFIARGDMQERFADILSDISKIQSLVLESAPPEDADLQGRKLRALLIEADSLVWSKHPGTPLIRAALKTMLPRGVSVVDCSATKAIMETDIAACRQIAQCQHGKGVDERCEKCAPASEGNDVIHRPSFDGGGGMYSAPEDLPTTDYKALYMQQADLVSKLVTDLTEANSEIQSMKQSRPPLIHADDTWVGAINGVLKQARIYDISDQDFEIACRMGMAAFRKARDHNARFPHDPEWSTK